MRVHPNLIKSLPIEAMKARNIIYNNGSISVTVVPVRATVLLVNVRTKLSTVRTLALASCNVPGQRYLRLLL